MRKDKYLFFKCKKGVILLLCLSFIAFGCIVKENSTKHEKMSNEICEYKKMAFDKYRADTSFLFSPNRHNVLCANGSMRNDMLNDFIVINVKSNKIIYEDKIARSKISWYTDNELLVTEQKGIITSSNDSGVFNYLIDLTTKKRKELNKSEIKR